MQQRGGGGEEDGLDTAIAAFLSNRLGDDEWILQDLIVFLGSEYRQSWQRWRMQLGEQDEQGWLAALTARLQRIEGEQHFRL